MVWLFAGVSLNVRKTFVALLFLTVYRLGDCLGYQPTVGACRCRAHFKLSPGPHRHISAKHPFDPGCGKSFRGKVSFLKARGWDLEDDDEEDSLNDLVPNLRVRNPILRIRTLVSRCVAFTIRAWRRLKKLVRRKLRLWTVYVLECEGGNYYVGMTVDRRRRLKEHRQGKSAWTSQHKPIRVQKLYRMVPHRYVYGFEAQVTAELMWKHGVNNVRGAMFAQRKPFDHSDINGLVQFLGHHNDLPYGMVRRQLQQWLPPTRKVSPELVRRFRPSSLGQSPQMTPPPTMASKKCFQCGEYGHFAADCPTMVDIARKKCWQCGRYGHIAADCPEQQ